MIAPKASGAMLATAPISMPPAEPPWATMRSCGGEVLAVEIARRGDEIGKRVGLLAALAFLIPGKALLLAAANMGDGVDEAAVNQRKAIGVEAGGDGNPVGPVAVEQAGRAAVSFVSWR
jgi:hypothetical protein